ncbi:MAG: hypothetical protein SGJ19_24235 [Planctomycetia bacterium]|nr:hypothetical protein [Planctomycetia bacterium]
MQLRWIASSRASWAHAAVAIAAGAALADASLTELLAPPVLRLTQWLADQSVPDRFWEHLPPLAAGIPRNDELAGVLLTKTVGRDRAEGLKKWLAAVLREVELPWSQRFPELTDELALRAQPLQQQWDARGPGLMRLLGNLTEADLLVEAADVILVQPVLGGAGEPQLSYNSVRIEAVLADPIPELPELARLAWLVAQLNLDLPVHQELLSDLPATNWTPAQVCRLAMLPAVLAAAEQVELTRFDPATMRQALQSWCGCQDNLETVATNTSAWWETYRGAKPPIAVALRALAEMLA